MKKLWTLLLAVGMSICLCSCAQTPTAPPSSEQMRIAVSMSSRDQFLTTVENAILEYAPKCDVDCTVWDAGNDYVVQLQHVQDAVEQGYDALIINAVSPSLTRSIIREAGEMPVVFVNRKPEMEALTAGKQVFIGSDDREAGRFQAAWLNDYAEERGIDVLKLVYLTGIEGQDSTATRRDSLLEYLRVDCNFIYESTAQFDRAKAYNQVEILVDNGVEFDVVVAQNDEMAIGAAQVLREAGITDCPVLGIDGTLAGRDAIADGLLTFTVYQPGDEQGRAAVDAVLALYQGKDLKTMNIAHTTCSEDGLSLMIPDEPMDAQRVTDF